MKINQYCSVCKKHLDMDLVPTDDGADDGVIWLRCPECRGFLPKFSGDSKYAVASKSGSDAVPGTGGLPDVADADLDAMDDTDASDDTTSLVDDDDTDEPTAPAVPVVTGEPIAEYAAALAAADASHAKPYRASGDFAVGEVIFHLAWDDCGLVIAKEVLPGSRRAIKVYFASVGVVHLIEQSQDVY